MDKSYHSGYEAIRSESYASLSRGQSIRSEYQANLALVPMDRASTVIVPRKELRLPWWQRMLNTLLQQRSP